MTRAVPLCFPVKQALIGTAGSLIPCQYNVWLPAFLLARGFQIAAPGGFSTFLPTRLTLFPGSLLAVQGLLVPIFAYWRQLG
jgi:hypothetical protein